MSRNEFTAQHDSFLVQYIATYCPDKKNRRGNVLYENLHNNARGLWPWAKAHTAQSWRGRYVKKQEEFDRRIERFIRKKAAANSQVSSPTAGPSTVKSKPKGPSSQRPAPRIQFSKGDDQFLVKFLAIESPDGADRMGNVLYEALRERAESGKHEHLNKHPSSSWRERYKKHADDFDKQILEYQKRHGIDPKGQPRQELWKRTSADQFEDPNETSSPHRNGGSKASRKSAKQPRSQSSTEPKGKAVARPSKTGKEDDSETESDSEPEVQHLVPRRLGKRPARDDDDDDDDRGAARKRRRVREAVPQEEEEEGEENPQPAPSQPAKSPVVHEDEQSDVEMPPPIMYAGQIFDEGHEGNSGSSSDDEAAVLVDRLLSVRPNSPEEPPLSPSQADEIYLSGEDGPDHLEDGEEEGAGAFSRTNTLPAPGDKTDAPLGVPQEPTPPTSDHPASPTPRAKIQIHSPPSRKVTAKLKKRQQPLGSDGFQTPPPLAESSVPRPYKRKQPPMLAEGAYRPVITSANGAAKGYKGLRRKSGVDEDGKADIWPPKRNKGKGRALAAAPPTSPDPVLVVRPMTKAFATTRDSAADTLASGSPPKGKGVAQGAIFPPLYSKPQPKTEKTHLRRFEYTRAGATEAVAGPSTRFTPKSPGTGHIDRRHTLATPGPQDAPRQRAVSRLSLPILSPPHRSHNPESDGPSVPYAGWPLTREDLHASSEMGMRVLLQRLAVSKGFTSEVAENVFERCGTIADTEKILNAVVEGGEDIIQRALVALGYAQQDDLPEHEHSVVNERAAHRSALPAHGDDHDDEYYPPDNSKAAIYIKEQYARKSPHKRTSSSGNYDVCYTTAHEDDDERDENDNEQDQDDNEQDQDVNEQGEEEANAESGGEADSHELQAARILERVARRRARNGR